jgi:phosphoheptose isomerase
MEKLNFENIGEVFNKVTDTPEWEELQNKFNYCSDIFLLGHGGNLAVADHASADISRLSNGTKNAQAPGSAIVATSLINDTSFDDWMVQWLQQRTVSYTENQLDKSLVLGISSSGTSGDIIRALEHANLKGMQIGVITSYPFKVKIPNLTEVLQGVEFYHTAEVLSLLLTYQLTAGSGKATPPIFQNKPKDLEQLNRQSGASKERKYSYPDEQVNIAIDFDGVIHKNTKGYFDGTIYDEPIEGTREALEKISNKYTIIIHTAKARHDRGFVDGKSGKQLIWEWLENHNLDQFISKVTSEKPRAVAYIDDKSIQFSSWSDVLDQVENLD